MEQDQPFFIRQNAGFGAIGHGDELLHPQRNAQAQGDSVTETQYFGFCIPEERIHGFGYLWHHPHLKVVSGGLYVWRGHQRSVVHGELCDYLNYLSDGVLQDDLHHYRLPNSYSVEVLEPLQRHRMRYEDAASGNRVDIQFDAVAPAVMFEDGRHFEQALRARGELVLRGKSYIVDCYTVRDRSWGEPRTEQRLALPPLSWMQGVFDDDFAFTCNLFDQIDLSLVARGLQNVNERPPNGGWLWRDGLIGRFVRGRKKVDRRHEDRMPMTIHFEATDEHGRSIEVRGDAIASTSWMPWNNIVMPIVLMRWQCEGRVAYGDCQEGIWNDFLHLTGNT